MSRLSVLANSLDPSRTRVLHPSVSAARQALYNIDELADASEKWKNVDGESRAKLVHAMLGLPGGDVAVDVLRKAAVVRI